MDGINLEALSPFVELLTVSLTADYLPRQQRLNHDLEPISASAIHL